MRNVFESLQDKCNNIHIYILNPYNLVRISGESCASKTVQNKARLIFKTEEVVFSIKKNKQNEMYVGVLKDHRFNKSLAVIQTDWLVQYSVLGQR